MPLVEALGTAVPSRKGDEPAACREEAEEEDQVDVHRTTSRATLSSERDTMAPRTTLREAKSRRGLRASGVIDAEDELEFFENLQKVRKAFLDNDLNNDGVITAEELKFLAEKLGGELKNENAEMCERVINGLKIIARNRGNMDARLDEDGIPFEVFAQILYSHDTDDEIDEDLQDSLQELRTFFQECGNARMLEEAADVSLWEIDETDKSIGERILRILDPVMGFAICCNAILIGVSIDHHDPPELEIVEYMFVVLYVAEVIFKMWYYGVCSFFVGYDWSWHWFDTFLAILGVVNFIAGVSGANNVDLGPFMYMRLLRVMRLARLVRLMKAFKDLSIMVTGLFAGLKTMMWVMLILAMVIYSMAVVLTAVVGRDETSTLPYREELFSTVTRSMFTMFVCLTDGCTNYDGTPISHQLFDSYGLPFFLAYTLAVVIVTFGLFNLIMAIFVENTMEAAKSNDIAISAARHKENLRVARKLKLVIQQFTLVQSSASRTQCMAAMNEVEDDMKKHEGLRGYFLGFAQQEKSSGVGDRLLKASLRDGEFKLSRRQFDMILATRIVQSLLDELEIDETDRKGLFDVLDSDCSGTITIEELISGLMAVRGQARKSDTVATMLAVKSVQKSLRTMAALMIQNHHWVDERLQVLEQRQEATREEVEAKLSSLDKVASKMDSLEKSITTLLTAVPLEL
eukprot:CAMPEP_0171172698 /NCGR_PEP_ID=MMETSP0790-20130122/9849_1 /TAXON_ID=2925 /ORGANISM="Alexandrium catenella, Strain OF101" /LENGTH=687 /DNA_ID=CAMNT_0011637555 /DNA_START=19 /DNA_END=2082 /DNA_ORIENTATION=-